MNNVTRFRMNAPDIRADAIRLLRELTEAHGVPGSEDAVRSIFRRELEGHGTFLTDRLGSTACERSGPSGAPRVLVAGHFDEVGFAVQSITSKGFLRLVPLGGWWMHTVVAQRLRILTSGGGEVIGVTGSTPPHLQGDGPKDRLLTLEQVWVDVGATSREEVEALGIQPGDPVAPFSEFTAMGPDGVYLSKAFDNRCGVAAAIQTMQSLRETEIPCTLIAAGTVQEELGCRGAQTLGALARPDVAIVLEGTPADDTPGAAADEPQGALGGGVQIRILDPGAVSSRPLVRLAIATAQAEGIPFQLAVRRGGATDARALQFAQIGVPCIVLGTPARYIHSHNTIIKISDYLSCFALTRALVRALDAGTVDKLTQFGAGGESGDGKK